MNCKKEKSTEKKIVKIIAKLLSEKLFFSNLMKQFSISVVETKINYKRVNIYILPLSDNIINSYIIKELNIISIKYNKILFIRKISRYILKIKFLTYRHN